jgi:hypothetical protein
MAIGAERHTILGAKTLTKKSHAVDKLSEAMISTLQCGRPGRNEEVVR